MAHPLTHPERAFAGDPGARQGMHRLPFIPNLNLFIVSCIDCRVDPAGLVLALPRLPTTRSSAEKTY